MHVNPVLHGVEAEFVGRAITDTGLHTAAGHELREPIGVVVAAPAFRVFDFSLQERRATKLPAPDHEGIVKEAALLQVADERRRRGVDIFALNLELGVQIAVLVPAGVHHLNKAHAAFGEAAGHEAIVGVTALAADFGAVGGERGRGLFRKISEFGDAGLHLIGHLILCDARGDLGVAEVRAFDFVELGEVVEEAAANGAAHAGGIRKIEDGVAGAAEGDALILRREETTTPVKIVENLAAARLFVAGGHHDKCGELLGFVTEAVAEPRTE